MRPGQVNIVNQAAQHAAQVYHRQINDTMHITDSLRVSITRQVVRDIAEVAPSVDDLRALGELVRDAQRQNLELAKVVAQIQQDTPFGGVAEEIARDRRLAIWLTVIEITVHVLLALLLYKVPPEQPAPEVSVETEVDVNLELDEEEVVRQIDEAIQKRFPETPGSE